MDAHQIEAAQRVAARISQALDLDAVDVRITPYADSGFVAEWRVVHDATTRDALIVDILRRSQVIASGWILTGSVDDDIGAVASRTGTGRIAMTGVTMFEWQMET